MLTLPPGAYTAIVRGNGNASGVAVIEVYDLSQAVDDCVDVLACSWLEGRELHVVERGEGRGLFIAVEDSASARGRRLMLMGRQGVPASDMLWSSWLAALVRQSTVDERGMWQAHLAD